MLYFEWDSEGTTSVTPTLLRLTSSFDEGDGRFVHYPGGLIQVFYLEKTYFQVRLSRLLWFTTAVSEVEVVTHLRLLVGCISTWFDDGYLVAYVCCEVNGRRQYAD